MECKKVRGYIITTGSITYAIKGRDILRRLGYRARIEKRTSGLGSDGCGYSIIVEGKDIEKAEQALRNAAVKILQINEL